MQESDVFRIAHRAIDESLRIGRLESEAHRLGVLYESLDSKTDKVIDLVMETQRQVAPLQRLVTVEQRLVDRQEALEDAHRRHGQSMASEHLYPSNGLK